MNDLIEEYLTYVMVDQRLSDNTYLSYKYELEAYVKFLGELGINNLNDVKTSDIEDFLSKNKDYKSKTIQHKLTVIKNFHNFLLKNKKIKENVATLVDKPKLNKNLPNVLSIEEVDKLLDINLVTPQDYRNKAMLELMYATGLRISELLTLEFSNINLDSCTVNCIGKGNKERIIPIGDVAIYHLNKYLEVRSQISNKRSEYIFISKEGKYLSRQSFFKILKKQLLIKGINKDVTPHTIRHSFATHLIQGGADLRVVQELLGHSDISTTRIYTHISNNKIKDDFKKYHPRGDE